MNQHRNMSNRGRKKMILKFMKITQIKIIEIFPFKIRSPVRMRNNCILFRKKH